jgi:hypothetical protein
MASADRRKRVKTGCSTCRTRRRKCDEQKPECGNCLSKGFTCQYRTNLTFVASKFQDDVVAEPKRHPGSHDLRHSFGPDSSVLVSPGPNARATTTTASPLVHDDRQVWPEPEAQVPTPETFVFELARTRVPQTRPSAASNLNDATERSGRQGRYELELLTYFRYNVAPVLDLGIRGSWFGVTSLIAASTSESTQSVLLAIAASQRGTLLASNRERDLAAGTAWAYSASDAHHDHIGTQNFFTPLQSWRKVYLTPVDEWHSCDVGSIQRSAETVATAQEWLVLARLYCALRMTSSTTADAPSLISRSFQEGHQIHSSGLSQLESSLALLAGTLAQAHFRTYSSQPPSSIPAAQWHKQWQALQHWYALRTHDMKQIMELPPGDNQEFPIIVFTSHCATVANAAHHMSAAFLLRRKPRLLKFGAEPDSSTSVLWHLNRAIGIVVQAAYSGCWDISTTAILLSCARYLSSVQQIQAVIRSVAQIRDLSGLQLSNSLVSLENLAEATRTGQIGY